MRLPRAAALVSRALSLLAVSALTLVACAPADAEQPPDAANLPRPTGTEQPTDSPPAELSGTLIVYAAASLTETFTELGDQLMASYPGLMVTFNFGGSSGLAAQITSGAPADVFAAASPATMQTVVDAGAHAEEPEVFARNTLQIAVPAENPAQITELADFARPELTLALCAPEVPCGAAAAKVFAAAGLTPAPDTLEQDVRAALTKVRLGEVDGALVYRTDVLAARDGVRGIDFPQASAGVNDYPIAVLADAPSIAAARAFVELVRSASGQEVLADAGFTGP